MYRLDHKVSQYRNKRGGGLIAYIKNGLDVRVHDSENVSTKDIEIQWLRITRNRAKDILLGNLYRPPNGKLGQAINALEIGLTLLKRINDEVVIIGDINVDYKNKKSPNYKQINFFEKANSLDQKITTATRNTKSSSSLLDVAFTNMKYIKSAGTLDSFLSDHQPIFLLKKKDKHGEKLGQQFEGRSYRNYNKQSFSDNILASDWSPFYNAPDPSKAWDEMLSNIVKEADKMCPVRKFRIRNNKPCWLTNKLIEQMKDRDYFYRKAKQTNSEDDWNIAKFHRNQVNFNMRKAKADFIKEQLRNHEGNNAKFWRTIKQIMPNKKGTNNGSKIFLHDKGEAITDCYNIANHMNKFFANLGTVDNPMPKISDSDPNSPISQNLSLNEGESSFNFELVTAAEVEALIRKINVSKSSGITMLSSKILKDCFQTLSDKLTYLFNFSIRATSFPDQWKNAVVIPIPKQGDSKVVENYRPISLLPIPGKILEKLIHTQLSFYLEENELLTEHQFGFRKQRSTSHAISQLLNQIYTNINKSVITTAVYIDFSKAFNCVQHSTLLNKLSALNLGHNALKWITSYLKDRQQRTLVNNTYSLSLSVPQGVPQGSVLGPLFYIIYSNDIANIIQNSGFTFYADDTVIYSKKKTLTQAGQDLQTDLDNLSNWCVDNEIYINSEKSKVMFFGSKARIETSTLPDFNIGGTTLQRAKTYTYLGIKLDEQLSLETHANSLISKVSNKIYHLSKIRSFITKKAAILIYKNMILPILEYGDIFLHSASQKIRKKLQTLQNKALRCALNKEKYTETNVLHEEAKILKLKERRHMHVLLHMFQLSQMPNFKIWKAHKTTGVRTRSSKKKLISFKRPNNEKYKRSITYQGPKLWNLLPGYLQKIDSYYDFKTQVKKLFQFPKSRLKPKPKPKPK